MVRRKPLLSRKLIQETVDLLKQGDKEKLNELFEELQPFDMASLTTKLTTNERKTLFSFLSDQVLSDIFQELEEKEQEEYIKEMGLDRAAGILNVMSNDDATDLLAKIGKSERNKLFELMSNEEESKVRQLLKYPETSAGGLMTTEYITLPMGLSASEALDNLRHKAGEAETIYYIYIVDENKKLAGVISLRELIMASPEQGLEFVMNKKIMTVPPELDQEETAKIIEKYDFLALPVVDREDRLLGIVTVDDIIDVLTDEATEDISKLSGISGEPREVDRLQVSSIRSARKRLPWLMILLVVGILSGSIISQFEETLEAVVVLAIFIPMIADMAGNTGTQSLAMVVRGLALGEFGKGKIYSLIRREAGVGLIIGTVNGVLIAIIASLWQQNPYLGFVIGFSLWVTLFFATLSGAIVPLILHRLKVDPAVASGPFITTINDILGLTIYFTVATRFMDFL